MSKLVIELGASNLPSDIIVEKILEAERCLELIMISYQTGLQLTTAYPRIKKNLFGSHVFKVFGSKEVAAVISSTTAVLLND